MINRLYKIFRILGVDKAIAYTSLLRVIQATGGVVSIIFVARFLTGTEQGFYYTFGSIVAIQIFFELGLNGIITQYVAHEASHLTCKDDRYLDGESKYISRLSSLLHFSVKWYLLFALGLLTTLVIVGYWFFTKYSISNEDISWRFPWVLLAIGTTLQLLLSPILAYIEGLGMVKDIAKIKLVQQLFGLAFVFGGLCSGLKLYVPGINSLLGFIIILHFLSLGKYKTILLSIWREPIVEKVKYRTEIFPYQWKIALSWVSGYFISQLFNPVIFAIEGPVVAGQMGMTLSALGGITALSLSWMSTKVPLYSGLIELKRYKELDSVFSKALKQSTVINAFLLLCFILVIFFIRHFQISIGTLDLGKRFLNYIPMILMMIPILVNQFVGSWATYLRCHKKEPYLIVSIVSGVLCCISTVFLCRYFGILGVTGGYCLIVLGLMPWEYHIYKTKKQEWHGI